MIDVVVQHVRFDLEIDFNLACTNTLTIQTINTKSTLYLKLDQCVKY